jgi:hypothetical protein
MKPAQRMQRQDHKAFASLPAPQRMQKMIELSRQRTAMMEARLPALNTFYAALSPQQQKVFDEQTSHGMGGHGMHGGHGMRGEHREGAARG